MIIRVILVILRKDVVNVLHSGTTDWVWDYRDSKGVILMTEMILGGDSYEKSCWYWFRRHSGTTDWVWDITMVILGRDSED